MPLAHCMHAGTSVLSARMVLLPTACFTSLQVSAAMDIRSSPGAQAAVLYALQLALLTEEYREPQAPGEEAGPDPFPTDSKNQAQPAIGVPAMSLDPRDMHLQPEPFAEGWTGWLLEGVLHGERAVFKSSAVPTKPAQVSLFEATFLPAPCLKAAS